MSVQHRNPDPADPADPAAASVTESQSATESQPEIAGPEATSAGARVPRTRTGAAWLGVCIAAVALVVLIIFMLQNTRRVEVTFLWMHGSVPLAMALLVAAVGVAILAIAVGAARTTQLRRLFRHRH